MAGTPPLEAVIFDVDGTLLDTLPLFFQVVEETWEKLGLPVPDRQIIREILIQGQPFWDFWPQLVPPRYAADAALKNRAQELEREIWNVSFKRLARLVPGAAEALRQLKAKGLKLAIVTSRAGGENHLPFAWAGVPMEQYFAAVITPEQVKRFKPAPDPILACLERLGTEPSRGAYVGDSAADIRAGRAAGVVTIGVLTGVGTKELLAAAGADKIIGSVADLPREVEGEGCYGGFSQPQRLS